MTPHWPPPIPLLRRMFHPDVPSRSGGLTISGDEQVTVSSAGRWRAALSFFIHKEKGPRRGETILLFRAMLARNQGRANSFLIGPYDDSMGDGNTPAAMSGVRYGDDTLHSDDSSFDDDTSYTQADTPAHSLVIGETGETTLDVVMDASHVPEPGQYFGVNDRLYLISRVTEIDTDTYTLEFWPPLRDLVQADQPVEFDSPVCKMRFAQDATGQLDLALLYASNPSIECVEVAA